MVLRHPLSQSRKKREGTQKGFCIRREIWHVCLGSILYSVATVTTVSHLAAAAVSW